LFPEHEDFSFVLKRTNNEKKSPKELVGTPFLGRTISHPMRLPLEAVRCPSADAIRNGFPHFSGHCSAADYCQTRDAGNPPPRRSR
jgi:hypothetical protein